jgi:hypothetical protein
MVLMVDKPLINITFCNSVKRANYLNNNVSWVFITKFLRQSSESFSI